MFIGPLHPAPLPEGEGSKQSEFDIPLSPDPSPPWGEGSKPVAI